LDQPVLSRRPLPFEVPGRDPHVGVWRTSVVPGAHSPGLAPAVGRPSFVLDQPCGPGRQLDRTEVIVTAVEHVVAHARIPGMIVAACALDLRAVEGRDLVVRRRCEGDVGGEVPKAS